jgi:ankyrin repeat protein
MLIIPPLVEPPVSMVVSEAASRPSLQFLLDTVARMDDRDAAGQTHLHHCARLGRLQEASLLCKAGAMVNATDHQKRTPLFLAISEGQVSMALLLVSLGADVRKSPAHDRLLIRAIEAGSPTVVRVLLEGGVNPNEGNRHGWFSPLAVAITRPVWSLPVIEALLEAGAHADAALCNGCTVAHEVARRRHEPGAASLWSLLLRHGLHPDLPDAMGFTARALWESPPALQALPGVQPSLS